jgi:serine/threonine protein kinase
MWQPGQKVDKNRYQLEKPLGKGGFGITYLAKDLQQSGKYCVIKRLQGDLPNFELEQEKFKKECLRLARCPHANIAQIDNFKAWIALCDKKNARLDKDREFKIYIERCTEAIIRNPSDPDKYTHRANLRMDGARDKKGAIEDYTQAIILKPNALHSNI